MITGNVIIDGVDVKSTYGAYVVEGGFVDIPCIPDMKEPVVNDWYEYNGVEADLESPKCMSVRHTVVFMMRGDLKSLDSFLSMLRSKRVVSFNMTDISRTVNMRIESVSPTGISIGLYRITVVLSEDNPLADLESVDLSYANRLTGLVIDGKDVGVYGMSLIETLDWLYPGVDIKDNLLHSSDFSNGETHYPGKEEDAVPVKYSSKDIDINFVMRAITFDEFWKKRDALAFDLFRPAERVIEYNGVSMKAYYKGCRSRAFMYSGNIWWMFELSFGYLGGD